MSVTGSRTKLLFCEGKATSLDFQILSRLLRTPNAQVVPCGGKSGLPSFIDGRLSGIDPQPPFIGFCDRDFDREPAPQCSLLEWMGAKPIFRTHKACVENYLLDVLLIHKYWAQNEKTPKWGHGPSPGSVAIAEWIERSARMIADYQAIRWALAGLKPEDGRWPSIPTTWTKASGVLPDALAFDACLPEARSLVEAYRTKSGFATTMTLERLADEYMDRFETDEFWRSGAYLTWFHGKDLSKCMARDGAHSISLRHYFDWAVDEFNWKQHEDLVELEVKVNA